MTKTQIAVDVFNNNALKYQEKFMYFDLYNDTFDTFCNHIHKHNAAVLDIACGPGNISKYLLSKRPDFQIIEVQRKDFPTIDGTKTTDLVLIARIPGKQA